jgi:signal transduction histidine kinase
MPPAVLRAASPSRPTLRLGMVTRMQSLEAHAPVTGIDLRSMEQHIARARVVLAFAAMLVVYIDPETPVLARWIPFIHGPFVMDPRLLIVMMAFVAYSLMVYVGLQRARVLSSRVAARTVWADVLFGVAIATMTEGVTGPSYPFFAFAVVSSALRGGLRQAMLVTAVNLGLYMCLIAISPRHSADVYIMRPVYLGITGYLVSYLGQQRLELQEQMRQLEIAAQRHRIARDLHDGYAQALAGINLRLESARRLLRTGGPSDVLADLTDLQDSVNREYDDLRRYARTLAGVEVTETSTGGGPPTQVSVRAEVSGPVELIDQVLSIAREGLHNVSRHALARTAVIAIRDDQSRVRIELDDDGVGFRTDVMPWSIASRVKEVGGEIRIATDGRAGAHLSITLPRT